MRKKIEISIECNNSDKKQEEIRRASRLTQHFPNDIRADVINSIKTSEGYHLVKVHQFQFIDGNGLPAIGVLVVIKLPDGNQKFQLWDLYSSIWRKTEISISPKMEAYCHEDQVKAELVAWCDEGEDI